MRSFLNCMVPILLVCQDYPQIGLNLSSTSALPVLVN